MLIFYLKKLEKLQKKLNFTLVKTTFISQDRIRIRQADRLQIRSPGKKKSSDTVPLRFLHLCDIPCCRLPAAHQQEHNRAPSRPGGTGGYLTITNNFFC